VATLVATLVAGCAAGSSASSASAAAASRANPSVITAEEIARSSGQNAYEVIKELRPRFLQSRGATTPGPGAYTRVSLEPVVYVDERRLSSFNELSQVPVSQIGEIRHYGAAEATAKWGTGHSAGAIQILVKKRVTPAQ
jgi:hypothetical protein